MRNLIFALAFAGAIFCGRAQFSCTPNESYYDGCNTCVCNQNGTNAACTMRACSETQQQLITTTEEPAATTTNGNGNQVCTPNEIKMQEETNETCNRCKCAANGIGWFCTKIPCPSTRARRQIVDKQCTPGDHWKEDCNDCWCTDRGLALCTRIGCQHAAKRVRRSESCVPGTSWQKDCNRCFCTETGLAACTLRGCLGPHGSNRSTWRSVEPSEAKSPDFRCTPGESFKVDCNWCKCSEDGTSSTCTERGCLGNIYVVRRD